MLGIDLRGIHLIGNAGGRRQHPLEALGEGQLDIARLVVEVEHFAHLSCPAATLAPITAILLGEHGRDGPLGVAQGDAVLLEGGPGILRPVNDAKEHDLGAHRGLALGGRFVLRRYQCADALLRHALEQH